MITVVGIVGGIGSGKSAVSDQFRRLGAEILDGDRLGHEVLAEPPVIEALRNRWGERVIRPAPSAGGNETINRSEVAKIVFADTSEAETELRYLESITHPRIRARIAARLEALEQEHEHAERPFIVVLDAPLLLEAGWEAYCHYLIYVDVPRKIRLQRLASRGWDEAELAAREARQLPLDEKRVRADWTIDNSGPLEKMSPQIEQIWGTLTLPKSL